MVEIIAQPASSRSRSAAWSRCSATIADPGMEIEIALRKHDLPHEFSAEVLDAGASAMPARCSRRTGKGREDLRELPLVTIDGETARDFDDAVYCEPRERARASG